MARSHWKQQSPVVVDLFSGPGGLSLGFKQAGFTIGIGVEADPAPAQTYKDNFPHAEVIETEISHVDSSDIIARLDRLFPFRSGTVLIGGPPCQPFSNANMHLRNKGNDHPSFSTVDIFVRLIEKLMPNAFLFENVTAFETLSGGKCMKSLIAKIRNLGFTPSTTRLDTVNFGVPQGRRRLFIGGVRKSAEFSLPPPQAQVQIRGFRSRFLSVKDAISDLPSLPFGGGGTDVAEYSHVGREGLRVYQRSARRGATKLFNHWSSRHSEPVLDTIRRIPPGLSLRSIWKNLPLRIRNRYSNMHNIQYNIYRRLSWGGISPTIVHARRAMLLHPAQIRIISVREAARLQGFPDTFRFNGGIDSQYQQVANAVPPPLAKSLALLYRRGLD